MVHSWPCLLRLSLCPTEDLRTVFKIQIHCFKKQNGLEVVITFDNLLSLKLCDYAQPGELAALLVLLCLCFCTTQTLLCSHSISFSLSIHLILHSQALQLKKGACVSLCVYQIRIGPI